MVAQGKNNDVVALVGKLEEYFTQHPIKLSSGETVVVSRKPQTLRFTAAGTILEVGGKTASDTFPCSFWTDAKGLPRGKFALFSALEKPAAAHLGHANASARELSAAVAEWFAKLSPQSTAAAASQDQLQKPPREGEYDSEKQYAALIAEAKAGDPAAMYNLGAEVFQRGDTIEAIRWFKRSAAAGDTDAPDVLDQFRAQGFDVAAISIEDDEDEPQANSPKTTFAETLKYAKEVLAKYADLPTDEAESAGHPANAGRGASATPASRPTVNQSPASFAAGLPSTSSISESSRRQIIEGAASASPNDVWQSMRRVLGPPYALQVLAQNHDLINQLLADTARYYSGSVKPETSTIQPVVAGSSISDRIRGALNQNTLGLKFQEDARHNFMVLVDRYQIKVQQLGGLDDAVALLWHTNEDLPERLHSAILAMLAANGKQYPLERDEMPGAGTMIVLQLPPGMFSLPDAEFNKALENSIIGIASYADCASDPELIRLSREQS